MAQVFNLIFIFYVSTKLVEDVTAMVMTTTPLPITSTEVTTTTGETEDISGCDSSPCQNGGTCQLTAEGYICTCPRKYLGEHCETYVSDCEPGLCRNGATCVDTRESFECICPKYHFGTFCEIRNGECGIECQNGGTCVELPDGPRCMCASKYTGEHCEMYISLCASDPCQNGGTCVEMEESFRCVCPADYIGPYCSIFEGPCECLHGGICVEKLGRYECQCHRNYTGEYCETYISECDSKPCQNGGTCEEVTGGYKCTCPRKYTGKYCETYISECDSKPCQNGGTCEEITDGFMCICPRKYTGKYCETYISECDSKPCQNGGTCKEITGGYMCTCPRKYTGKYCETYISECDSKPCQNGGTCEEIAGGYMCTCPRKYTGKNCETYINYCDPNPCQNGGTCVDGILQYLCQPCMPGFVGRHCEIPTCDIDNGGCEQNCAMDGASGLPKCTCCEGYLLNVDGKTCSVDKMYVLARQEKLLQHCCNVGANPGYRGRSCEAAAAKLTNLGMCREMFVACCRAGEHSPAAFDMLVPQPCRPKPQNSFNKTCLTSRLNYTTSGNEVLFCPQFPNDFFGQILNKCEGDFDCNSTEKCCRASYKESGYCMPAVTSPPPEAPMYHTGPRGDSEADCPPADITGLWQQAHDQVTPCKDNGHCDQRQWCCPVGDTEEKICVPTTGMNENADENATDGNGEFCPPVLPNNQTGKEKTKIEIVNYYCPETPKNWWGYRRNRCVGAEDCERFCLCCTKPPFQKGKLCYCVRSTTKKPANGMLDCDSDNKEGKVTDARVITSRKCQSTKSVQKWIAVSRFVAPCSKPGHCGRNEYCCKYNIKVNDAICLPSSWGKGRG
ncbi:fibropellin-1 [Lingula anatina]|uniref:Fibropellin-1 n=1 Tax=Lingula anatina TaxID=7574 RepID=A0A1S3JGQ2_LINAN|nr:fibropellin-1 [Lingula anatina]|eukprot:XP_013409326.1 fibropellin-1 [Lingula anatina]